MKKIFCVVMFMAIFLFNTCATVSAAKKDFTDKNYNFSNIRRVYLCKVDTSVLTDLDALVEEQIQNDFKNFAYKLKGVVFVADEKSADLKIMPKINVWEISSYYVPERVEVYYEGYEERRVKVSEGEWKRERGHYKTSRIYFPGATRKEKRFPAHYEYDSVIDVSFEVYDVNNAKLVISRKDERKRGGKTHHLNMFKRSCKSFFKDFNKKLS